jgi:hypothetical protein
MNAAMRRKSNDPAMSLIYSKRQERKEKQREARAEFVIVVSPEEYRASEIAKWKKEMGHE